MQKIFFSIFIALFALWSVNGYAAEDLTAAKRDNIKKLLQVTGSLQIAQNMSEAVVKQMTETVKTARPDIPDRMFDVMREEVNKVIAEEMTAQGGFVDLMVALYHKYYTHEDIKGLLAFFQSPLGRKAGRLGPVMSQEGFAIGQHWGQALGPKIERRVKARFMDENIEI